MKVLITAPLRQDPDVFDAYQDGLDKLIIPDGVQVDRFYVVNNCPEVVSHIRDAKYVIEDTNLYYEKTGNDHLWTPDLMTSMSRLRNITIKEALENGYDYWLSIDTDIVVHPDTLIRLLAADKDIVSEIFWTQAPSGKYWCNAWMYDQAAGMTEEWKKPGLYEVGMTGALTLVNRRVFEAGVNYTPIPNIKQALRGEDRHFCIRAACAGFHLWVDTHCPANHLYTRKLFEEYKRERG